MRNKCLFTTTIPPTSTPPHPVHTPQALLYCNARNHLISERRMGSAGMAVMKQSALAHQWNDDFRQRKQKIPINVNAKGRELKMWESALNSNIVSLVRRSTSLQKENTFVNIFTLLVSIERWHYCECKSWRIFQIVSKCKCVCLQDSKSEVPYLALQSVGCAKAVSCSENMLASWPSLSLQ